MRGAAPPRPRAAGRRSPSRLPRLRRVLERKGAELDTCARPGAVEDPRRGCGSAGRALQNGGGARTRSSGATLAKIMKSHGLPGPTASEVFFSATVKK